MMINFSSQYAYIYFLIFTFVKLDCNTIKPLVIGFLEECGKGQLIEVLEIQNKYFNIVKRACIPLHYTLV